MALIDRIKFDGPRDGSAWLVYKCPSDKYVLGSQLIVSEGQEALFFAGGEALDLFGPGTHTLRSGNLPLLNALVNLPFGGKTPFSAEVYFVNKTPSLGMLWGTSTPIPTEDPKYGLILNVGARGQYAVSVIDSRRFVTQVVGAILGGSCVDQTKIARYLNGLINAHVKSVISEQLVRQGVSFLEISQYLLQVSEALRLRVAGEFERFGIEVTDLFCESIAPRPEEYEKLRQYKEELALGAGFYQQRRSLDIMEKLAENPSSGGMANAGMGLGMGLGALQQLSTLFGGTSRVIDPFTSTPCPACGALNGPGSRFCSSCGAPLAPARCPACGSAVPPASRFCGSCGKDLGGSTGRRE